MKQTKKGFTLIELLIVIAIIGILAAIAIPQYARYRRNAQDAATQSALHNIRLVQEALFAQDPNAKDYTSDYTALAKAGLVKDPAIKYGTIVVGSNANAGTYSVTVQHSAAGSLAYTFNSARAAAGREEISTSKTSIQNTWK